MMKLFLKMDKWINGTIDKLFDVLDFFAIWGWCSYFFLKFQAGHVLNMFLNFPEISAWCSYKLGSYKKKVYASRILKARKMKLVMFDLLLMMIDEEHRLN